MSVPSYFTERTFEAMKEICTASRRIRGQQHIVDILFTDFKIRTDVSGINYIMCKTRRDPSEWGGRFSFGRRGLEDSHYIWIPNNALSLPQETLQYTTQKAKSRLRVEIAHLQDQAREVARTCPDPIIKELYGSVCSALGVAVRLFEETEAA